MSITTTETRTAAATIGEMARMHFRLPSNVKEVIERAAVVSGQSVTDFAVASLLETANEVLERQHVRMLTDRDRDIFLAMLDSEDGPNEALRKAAADYNRYMGKE
jgi:uncharacterized protein (DUF1778 family)